MTFDELKTGITDIVEHSDEKLSELPGFLDKIREDYETTGSLVEKVSNLEDRIRSLQDTNMKLYLSQVGQPSDDGDEDEDLTGADAIDDFWSKLESKEK